MKRKNSFPHDSPSPPRTVRTLLFCIGRAVRREFRGLLAPVIFFFAGFNLIVFTTNLILIQYSATFSSFLLASLAALFVGKAILVADAFPFVRRYDRPPLIFPILLKTAVYDVAAVLVRLAERLVRFLLIEHNPIHGFLPYLTHTFSWNHFLAVQIWVLVLFLIYLTAAELIGYFGRGELRRILFTSRSASQRAIRKQTLRDLLQIRQLAEKYPISDLRDPDSAAHSAVMDVLQRIARTSAL